RLLVVVGEVEGDVDRYRVGQLPPVAGGRLEVRDGELEVDVHAECSSGGVQGLTVDQRAGGFDAGGDGQPVRGALDVGQQPPAHLAGDVGGTRFLEAWHRRLPAVSGNRPVAGAY